MRILFVVPYTPNLIRTRSYNFIKSLAGQGHQVILATLWSGEEERESSADVHQYCEALYSFPLPVWKSLVNCLAVLPSDKPLQSAYCWQGDLAEKILTLLDEARNGSKIDVIHVEHLRGVRYGLRIQSANQNNQQTTYKYPPVVWDSVDNISYLFRQSSKKSKRKIFRWLTQLELSRTESYEAWLLSQFPQTIVTSEKDKQAFLSLLPADQRQTASITVIGNGVDLDYFKPNLEVNREENVLVVSGKMSYHANVSMVLYLVTDIMPNVWKHRADIKLWIVGKDPTKEIIALGENPNITVTGTVSDIRPFLQKATAAVVPLTYGAGVQFKVLESMACETPVVASQIAVMSLDTADGENILVADNPEGFANHILQLANQPNLQRKIGQAGRQYVEQYHSWTSIAAKLQGVYDAIVED